MPAMIKKLLHGIPNLFRRVRHLHTDLYSYPYYARRARYEEIIFSPDAPQGTTSVQYGPEPVIVSLTSYGRRMLDVCFAIESIMQQSWKPNRIILWLVPADFRHPLPEALLRQQKRGLEIIEYPTDIKSYKKLIPALEKFPDASIVTVDDDFIYNFDLLERLIKAHQRHPGHIVAASSYSITRHKNGTPKPYKQWNPANAGENTPQAHIFPLGGAGTLYPPHSLDARVTDATLFQRLCPTADDIWFNAMARLAHTPIATIPCRQAVGFEGVPNRLAYEGSLAQKNIDQNANDTQLANIVRQFGPIF